MRRSIGYNTRQSAAILSYVASLGGRHVTAAQIVEHFEQEKAPIGRTTVYRHLDKLANTGKVRRYSIDGISGACFGYIYEDKGCDEHFHLKCEECGALLHLECDLVNEIHRHILDRHTFQIDTTRTVFYGKCESCISRG